MKLYNKILFWVGILFILFTHSGARILPKPTPLPADATLLFFEATSAHQTIYLFGSIHGSFQSQIAYPLPRRIFHVLQQSQSFLYALLPEDFDEELVMQAMLSPLPWSALIEDEQITMLNQMLKLLDLSDQTIAELHSYHPWFVLNLLYYSLVAEMGFQSTAEEKILLSHALDHNIPVQGIDLLPLETTFIQEISQQFPQYLYNWMLMRFVFLSNGFNLPQALQNSWLQGDVLGVLDQMVISRSPDTHLLREAEVALYQQINQTLWQTVQQHEPSQTLFIALSADYLLDEEGFIDFLTQQGFSVKPI